MLYRDLLIVLPMREPSIFRGIAVSLLRPVIGSDVEIGSTPPNTEYIFSQLAVNIMWYFRLKIAICF